MLKGGIGFFDSGVGGLSVLASCLKSVGGYPVYYYGDNGRAPYGNRPYNEVRAYVREAFNFLCLLQPVAVVVACNTVTALMIEELRENFPFPIIGIEPAVLPAAREGERVLVLATKATAESQRLKNLIKQAKKAYPKISVTVAACLNLACLVEEGVEREGVDFQREFPRVDADCVVLGCTHYSFLRERIRDFYGAKVFDGNEGVAGRLGRILGVCVPNIDGNVDNFSGVGLGIRMLRRLPFIYRKNGRSSRFFRAKKGRGFCKVKNAQLLYFLGSGRHTNRQFCERMFVLYSVSHGISIF